MLGLWILGSVLLCLLALATLYCHHNIYAERKLMQKASRAGIISKQVTLSGGAVISYGQGPANGPPLLLIHGQTVAWQDYNKVLPALSKSFQIYAVDCFGHGASSHDGAIYSCQANGEALIDFIDTVIRGVCYISGHSSGGILAAWLCARAPERVLGVVLEDPPLFRVTPEEIQKDQGAFAWYDAYLPTHQFVTQIEETDFALFYLKHGYLLTLFGDLQAKIVQAAQTRRKRKPDMPIKIAWIPHLWLRVLLYLDKYDPAFGNAFYSGTWMAGIDQEALLAKIQCPAVYLKANTQYGKDGVLYAANTDEDAAKVEALIRHCRRTSLKSGHNIHFEHPDVFIAACQSLLQKA